MQQMIPPSIETNAKGSNSCPRGASRWRRLPLLATAITASGVGIALGSTVRFHLSGDGDPGPLFKPQQDFPPLAEWPPEVSLGPGYDDGDFDAVWDGEPEVPQSAYENIAAPWDTRDGEQSRGLSDRLVNVEVLNQDETPARLTPLASSSDLDQEERLSVKVGVPLTDRLFADSITNTNDAVDDSPDQSDTESQQILPIESNGRESEPRLAPAPSAASSFPGDETADTSDNWLAPADEAPSD